MTFIDDQTLEVSIMNTRKLEFEIPEIVSAYLQMDDDVIKAGIFKLLLADLASQGVISFGKAAEIAGTDKIAFITELGKMGISYFNNDISDVLNDAYVASRL